MLLLLLSISRTSLPPHTPLLFCSPSSPFRSPASPAAAPSRGVSGGGGGDGGATRLGPRTCNVRSSPARAYTRVGAPSLARTDTRRGGSCELWTMSAAAIPPCRVVLVASSCAARLPAVPQSHASLVPQPPVASSQLARSLSNSRHCSSIESHPTRPVSPASPLSNLGRVSARRRRRRPCARWAPRLRGQCVCAGSRRRRPWPRR